MRSLPPTSPCLAFVRLGPLVVVVGVDSSALQHLALGLPESQGTYSFSEVLCPISQGFACESQQQVCDAPRCPGPHAHYIATVKVSFKPTPVGPVLKRMGNPASL